MTEDAAGTTPQPPTDRPKVRPIDCFPVEHEGESMYLLRDPLGVGSDGLVVSPPVVGLASLMDGERSLEDIVAEVEKEAPGALTVADVGQVVEVLDRALLLDSPAFHEAWQREREAWEAADLRAPTHAGGAYHGDPETLGPWIDGFFDGAEVGEAGDDAAEPGGVRGLVAPHIDLHRGGPTYGRAYSVLRDDPTARTFVVFGTLHQGVPRPVILTRKGFGTPLGPVPCAADLLDDVVARVEAEEAGAGEALFEYELSHRHEHSIEFQAVMLRRLFPDRDIEILPVLCSDLGESVRRGEDPRERPEVDRFFRHLRAALAERDPAEVRVIAAADLAHVGPHFDPEDPEVDDTVLQAVEAGDRAFLEACAAGDAEGILANITGDNDARRVCGTGPILAALYTLGECDGDVVAYDQCRADDGSQAVTVAAVAWR